MYQRAVSLVGGARFRRSQSTIAIGLSMVVGLAMVAGCYQRPMSPELEYDRAQVEVLNEELENLDSDH